MIEKVQRLPSHIEITAQKVGQEPILSRMIIWAFATDSITGKEVGKVRFVPTGRQGLAANPPRWYATEVEVKPDYRRQGIADSMYRYVEQKFHVKIVPSRDQTEMGEAFWAGRGKSATGGDVYRRVR